MEIAGSEMRTFNMDHHGIVAAICQDIGLKSKIDSLLHKGDPRRVVSPGQAVVAMILNGLGFSNRRLYLTPQFFASKPVARLLGEDISANSLDDHTLGKALDEISEYGVSKFFSEIAFAIANEAGLLGNTLHNDTTSFSVEGEYAHEGEIKITYGHSKDKRSDLKQAVMNLVTTGSAGIPIWMSPYSGNASDAVVLKETMARVKEFQGQFRIGKNFRWVMDAAWYSENNIKLAGNTMWISRVPERIAEARKLLECKPGDCFWEDLGNGYKAYVVPSNYGKVSQRWGVIFSAQAYEREKKNFVGKFAKKKELLSKELWHLGCKVFKCFADAQNALKEISNSRDGFIISGKIEEIKKHDKRGRPATGSKSSVTGYKIVADFVDDEEYISRTLNKKGCFILATNATNLSSGEILSGYKEQQQVERGFRFLKDPWFMADSFFLKSTARITALMAVMSLSLMVYNLGQHSLRETLKKTAETIPNQVNKPTLTPTLKWIFQIMDGVSIVNYYDSSLRLVREIMVNLDDLRKKIIRLLGKTTCLIYGIPW